MWKCREQSSKGYRFGAAKADLRSVGRTAAFVLRVMPMLPSAWLDRFSPEPIHEQVALPGFDPSVPAELYRPGSSGPHPGVVICLGVIPFGVTHPQVDRLGRAMARRGFASLIVWSADMRALRISPDDTIQLADGYAWLTAQPWIDPSRSGLLGACVGAGFVAQAASDARIRDRVAFVACFAPFGSLRTLALDIGSGTTEIDGIRRPWTVDQLSRHVYVRTLTADLDQDEAQRLETAWFERQPLPDPATLSAEGRAILSILQTTDRAELERLVDHMPALRAKLDDVCPEAAAPRIRAPVVTIGHDRDDHVLPFGESQRLFAAFQHRPRVSLTEFHLFQHADPTKRKLHTWKLVAELIAFVRFCWPVMQMVESAARGSGAEPPDEASLPRA